MNKSLLAVLICGLFLAEMGTVQGRLSSPQMAALSHLLNIKVGAQRHRPTRRPPAPRPPTAPPAKPPADSVRPPAAPAANPQIARLESRVSDLEEQVRAIQEQLRQVRTQPQPERPQEPSPSVEGVKAKLIDYYHHFYDQLQRLNSLPEQTLSPFQKEVKAELARMISNTLRMSKAQQNEQMKMNNPNRDQSKMAQFIIECINKMVKNRNVNGLAMVKKALRTEGLINPTKLEFFNSEFNQPSPDLILLGDGLTHLVQQADTKQNSSKLEEVKNAASYYARQIPK